MAPKKNFYQILGVPENSAETEIKQAYRRLAKKYHPDRNLGDPRISDQFKSVGEAYGVLSDPKKRKQYDEMRRLPNVNLNHNGFGSQSPQNHFSLDDFSAFGGLGDIFSSIFEQTDVRTSSRYRTKPRRGQDIQYRLEVSFQTAIKGGKISIKIPVTEDCSFCSRLEAQTGGDLQRCAECRGTGDIEFNQGPFAKIRPCPGCFGRGVISDRNCSLCKGHGIIRKERRLHIRVPKGIDSGSKLRISGKGERGIKGGNPGNLIINFKVKPDKVFHRKNLDIFMTEKINLRQAMFGTDLLLKTVHGNNVRLNIPEGTQCGTKFKIRGRGLERDGRVGDHYVEVNVEIPKQLSEEERQYVEKVTDVSGMNS